MMGRYQMKMNIRPTTEEDVAYVVLLSARVERCTTVGHVFCLGIVCSLSFGDQKPCRCKSQRQIRAGLDWHGRLAGARSRALGTPSGTLGCFKPPLVATLNGDTAVVEYALCFMPNFT